MPTFAYTAISGSGQTQTGVIDAGTQAEVMVAVEAKGLMPIEVRESSGASKDLGPALTARRGRVKGAHVHQFARQLAGLLTAGVPLAKAMSILQRESTSPAAADLWQQIGADIADGQPLADAMGRHEKVFPPVYIAMVRAGETGGFLDAVLKQIAEFMTRDKELKGRVKSAMIYPLVLGVVAGGVVLFLLSWFIPKFSSIFDDFGRSLPLLTQLVQAASEAVIHYGFYLALATGLAAFGIKQALASDRGKRFRDEWLLKTPGIGKVLARFALVRFCRMFGTLTAAGVPLVQALRVSKQAIGNQVLGDALDDAIRRVQEGDGLAESLSDCAKLFPPSVTEVLAVAEASGQLDTELIRLADEHEQELDQQLRMGVFGRAFDVTHHGIDRRHDRDRHVATGL